MECHCLPIENKTSKRAQYSRSMEYIAETDMYLLENTSGTKTLVVSVHAIRDPVEQRSHCFSLDFLHSKTIPATVVICSRGIQWGATLQELLNRQFHECLTGMTGR